MKRVSFGIILPGNPECVQKEKTWLSIMTVICKKGWIVFLVVAIISIIMAFIKDDGDMLGNAVRPLWVFTVLLCCSFFWNDRHRCAYCGHFFQLNRISDEYCVDRQEQSVSRNVYDYQSGTIYDISGDITFYNGRSSRTEHGTRTKEISAVNKRCSCCGAVSKIKITRFFTSYH